MNSLINNLMKDGYLRSDPVINAFSEIGRVEFVPKEFEGEANADIALPIGFGQTISQPKTVAFMLELLDPQRGHNILDVGSGSGWTTALLCHIVGSEGRVTALEIVKELVEMGKRNVAKFNCLEEQGGVVEFCESDGKEGFSKNAPYDRILVSASSRHIPEQLKKQLKTGGKMVIPVVNTIKFLEKTGEDEFREENYPGFAFVPLV